MFVYCNTDNRNTICGNEVSLISDKELWGEVSMCDTPPTLIITVHCDLVQQFIEYTVLQLLDINCLL
jgi:hypothetical protein